MKTKILLLFIIVAGVSSCSTIYKNTQTPDDVYYSPARQQSDQVKTNTDINESQPTYVSSEDIEIWSCIRDRRWRLYDSYDAYNYRYGYGYSLYAKPGMYSVQNFNVPRKFNLAAYKNTASSFPKIDLGTGMPVTNVPVRTFQSSNPSNGTGVGNLIRKVITGNNNNSSSSNSNNSTPTRTFEPRSSTNNNSGSSNSSSGSKSSSTSAPVRTFGKGN